MPQETGPYIDVGSVEKDGSFIDYVPVKGRSILQILGLDKKNMKKSELIIDEDGDGIPDVKPDPENSSEA